MNPWNALVGALTRWRYLGNPLKVGYTPYADEQCNLLYNLLFCDKPKLLEREAGSTPQGDWAILVSKQPYAAGLRTIAEDQTRESRLRVVAYRRLREMEQAVPKGILLGVIIELGLPEGLDVLAAFPDGRVRYLNHHGSIAAFDPAPAAWKNKIRRLMETAQDAVERIGPWVGHRIAPPTAGSIRMSFLVSDGLYFGQGPIKQMEQDALAQPIIAAGVDLLKSVNAAA